MSKMIESDIPQFRSLTQIVGETVRQRIFDGEYAPGARLNISDLAQKFGFSPVPVREALRNLEAEGLVKFHANRGVVVRELMLDEVRELFLIRSRLETLAACEAARLAEPEDILALKQLVAKMDKNVGSENWHKLHTQFHQQLYAISQLPRLIQLVDVLRGQMRPYSRVYLKDQTHLFAAQKEHHEIVDAVQAHDTERMTAIVHEHLARPARIASTAYRGEPAEL
jgi:DNA-binding GntR family transcriptional regulator